MFISAVHSRYELHQLDKESQKLDNKGLDKEQEHSKSHSNDIQHQPSQQQTHGTAQPGQTMPHTEHRNSEEVQYNLGTDRPAGQLHSKLPTFQDRVKAQRDPAQANPGKDGGRGVG